MKADAQAHVADDKKRKEEIDTKNQADNLAFQTEKQLKEFGDKLSAETKGKVESANEHLKEAIKGGNISTIKSAMETLNAAWNEASTQMYQQATASGPQGGAQSGPEGGPAGGGASKPDEKKVEDAQFEVVDDKDKK